MEKEQPTKTSDQGFAAYLMLRGFFCAGAVEAPSGRLELVFVDVEDPKTLEDDYFRYRRENMSAKAYFEKVRTVKHIINSKLDEMKASGSVTNG